MKQEILEAVSKSLHHSSIRTEILLWQLFEFAFGKDKTHEWFEFLKSFTLFNED